MVHVQTPHTGHGAKGSFRRRQPVPVRRPPQVGLRRAGSRVLPEAVGVAERCQGAGFHGLCLTVDTLVAGNRERDHRTGFSTPPRLTLKSLLSFVLHPGWSFNYLMHGKFKLANIIHMTDKGSKIDKTIMSYINFIKSIFTVC